MKKVIEKFRSWFSFDRGAYDWCAAHREAEEARRFRDRLINEAHLLRMFR